MSHAASPTVNEMRPPCNRTIWRAIGSPRPVPRAPLPAAAAMPSSAAMPGPRSLTATSTSSARFATATSTWLAAGEYLTALSMSIDSSCCTRA